MTEFKRQQEIARIKKTIKSLQDQLVRPPMKSEDGEIDWHYESYQPSNAEIEQSIRKYKNQLAELENKQP